MKDFLTSLKEKFLIADGAFGTYLNQKGRPANICRTEENLKNPELVVQIHKEYIEAGAKVIETNTFDGNILKLSLFELEDKFELLNKLAVQNAKKAAKGKEVYIAGSIGPTNALLKPYGNLIEEDYIDIFSSQAKVLIEEGVDLIILETFSSLIEIENAVKGIRKIDSSIPVVAEITLLEDGLTKFGDSPETCFTTLLEAGANVVGINCTLGPAELFNHYRPYFDRFKNTLLSAMPNAGYPVTVGDRVVYPVSEEYFKEYGILFLENGVKFVGGCCGTTPSHINKLVEASKQLEIERKKSTITFLETTLIKEEEQEEALFDNELPEVFRKLGKEFIISVEANPPKSPSPEKQLKKLKHLKELGIDAVNIAENPLARVRMSAMVYAFYIKTVLGLEPILHLTCRDRNIIGLQSDLLGAYALGVRGILALTGDPTSVGEFPEATGVFDINSVGIVEMVSRMNKGFDFGMNKIKGRTNMFVGVAFNPLAYDLNKELKKLEQKVDAGAKFLQTQPIYSEEVLETLAKVKKRFNIPVLVGILPLKSYAHARFLDNEFPGINIPEHILKSLENSGKNFEKGVGIAREILEKAKVYVDGAYLMPPFNRFDIVEKIMKH